MTQIKLRRDTAANFTSKNPVLGVGEPAYETDTKKLKIGDGTTAYNSLDYFSMTDEFAIYREKYGAPSDSVPVVNTGNSITIKAGVSIETPNGTLTNATDMTYTYDFLTDRVLFATENDYYHAYAVYYGGKEPSPVGEQVFWFNNNVWTMISGSGTKTVFNTQKITPIAKIYQVDGTVKNIDYSSYTKTSAGGGGSTNISATLPLKIVDGVISLEVDGQTIQIVDGKLHANLDELGNEVNNLSSRVTAAEADISKKQDKLNPVAPLGINQTTISNVTDGTFLTDTSVTLNSALYINYTTDANARFLIIASGVGATPTSFIQIPFTLGDLISFPYEKNSDSNIGLVFGYWKDNLFYPTMLYKTTDYNGSLGSTAYAQFAFVSETGKSSLEKIATYYGQSSAVSKSTLVYHESMPLNATNYIQVTKNAGVPTVNMWFTIDGASSPNRGYTQRMYTSDTTVLENFNKTNVCLLLSNDTSKAINLTKVTRRELGDAVLDPTPDALTTALSAYSNSFDATAKVVTNDLSLAIGSGLAITDGKLTASSTAPANMVTTDTDQTITGAKTFTANTTNFKAVKADGQIDCTTLRASNPSFYTTNVSTFIGNNGTGVQMYDGAGNYAQFGIHTAAKSTYIQPFYNCENLYINNYGDNSDANGVAANVVISGAIKNKVNGAINDVLTSGNVTAYVIEEFIDGTEGYRIWSNGRCEQWGSFAGAKSITFLKNYADTNYMLLAYVTLKTSNEAYNGVFGTQKTTTGFTASGFAGTVNDAWVITTCGTVNWYTSGLLAS